MTVEFIAVAISAFLSSLVSFFSGFGLGTLLMPVIAIFFPLPLAIGLTAIVHLLHNLAKSGLYCRSIDWIVAAKFGAAATIFAIPGALLLDRLARFAPVGEYTFLGVKGAVSVLHISIGLLLILFASLEAFPLGRFRVKNLWIGGAVSGFFGGLSGNQGALRSLFLLNAKLDKRAFIGMNAAISAIVDTVRLVIYSLSFRSPLVESNRSILVVAVAAATGGVVLGAALLQKVTILFIQRIVIGLLYLLGALLILGVI